MASELKVPLDIPDVEVLGTEMTDDGRLLIRVESLVETMKCGVCGQEIKCSYGPGTDKRLKCDTCRCWAWKRYS